MDKLQVTVSPEDWGDLITKYAPHSKKIKNGDFTDGTFNIDTDENGYITKREGGPNYNSVDLSATIKDQYEAIFSDGVRHLIVVAGGTFKYSSGDTTFNAVQNGTGYTAGANFEFVTTQDRVYGGNSAVALTYDRTTSYGGVAYTAPRIKTMGAQAPSAAPTAGAPTAGGAVPAGAHTYKVTYLYYGSEESNGSAASAVQTAGGADFTIPLTNIPVGGYGVTARKIYRDNNDGNYVHLITISDNTTTTYNDALLIGATPTPIPTGNEVPPAFSLAALWLDKVWIAGISGDPFLLKHSEAQLPDIFPEDFEVICNQEDPITALKLYFGRLMVFNRKSIGQILGTDSDTFKYDQLPGSIGCVDNRTLQTRVVKGVPVLIWLSDRGFYTYDGNAINYISESIEDLVNFNIQQAIQQKNTNTQSSQAAFQGGTASQGIDLTSSPGDITVKGYSDGGSGVGNNPRRTLDDQADWESGLQIANLALRSGDNKLKTVTQFASSGSFPGVRAGNMASPTSSVRLNTFANHTGATNTTSSGVAQLSGSDQYAAQKITAVTRAGTITQLKLRIGAGIPTSPSAHRYRVIMWADSSGTPGSIIHTGAQRQFASVGTTEITETVSIAVGASAAVWIGIERIDRPNFDVNPVITSTGVFDLNAKIWNGVSWTDAGSQLRVGYTFSQTAVSTNGSYISQTYDTGSVTLNQATVATSGNFPSSFGSKNTMLFVDASNDGLFWSQVFVSNARANINTSFSLSGQRFIRFRITLSVTDDRETDTFNAVTVTFPNGVEWISPVIDCTADVSAYNAFTSVSTLNGGTVALTVATSSDNISYSAFGALGSAVVARYVKLKVTLTASGATVPTVTSITFTWTVAANLVSSAIDTAVNPPAGWDLFLASFVANGGTVQFQMRSATTSGGLAGESFQNVTNGEFPGVVTPRQWVQWKVILTATDGAVPVVNSVTVQWFIGNNQSIRPASIFTDSRYYVALAEVQETTNNILIEYDLNGKFRVHRGLSIATFSFFFNRPYFGLGDDGFVRKFLDGSTDNGVAIEAQVRTKAFDFSTQYKDNSDKVKIVGAVVLQIKNTGASYTVSYSVDLGETFYPMYLDDGSTTLTTGTNGSPMYRMFKPDWTNGTPIAGRTIMYQVYSNDANEVEIQSLKASALLRMQEPD